MIRLTRLNGKEYVVNGLLIESVEATPDTMITLVNGKKFVIRETIPQVLSALTNFYREINVIKTMQLQERDRKAEGLKDA